MREIVIGEYGRASITTLGSDQDYFAETQAKINRRSLIVWGEHCSECAYPSCYKSCEFYAPRSDLHCRRFKNGIEAIRVRGTDDELRLTRIEFLPRGKLEGMGPTRLQERNHANAIDRRVEHARRLLAQKIIPRRLRAAAAGHVNKYLKFKAAGRGDDIRGALFLIEAWLEEGPSLPFTLRIVPWEKSVEGLYQTAFTLRQGYNRILIPAAQIASSIPLDTVFGIQIEPVGDAPTQAVVFGLTEFISPLAPLSEVSGHAAAAAKEQGSAKTTKCVVWDLDDTIWKGTLAEAGIEGLTLNRQAAEAIRMLDSRGILNSVASKNEDAAALAALKHFGLDQYLLFPQVNWGPKSNSIRRICELIDIGIDSFVFVDDQAFERAEVAAAHPAVRIMTPEDIAGFATHPIFAVPVTEESHKRRFLYRDEERRHQAAQPYQTDYIGFLRNCGIRLDVIVGETSAIERIYELTQRTNQLNVTGARFTREDVESIIAGKGSRIGYALRCSDAFGDYGIIGFCVLNPANHEVEAFFMSCRVQRKRVENAFFAWIGHALAEKGAKTLRVKYRKTEKNSASATLFEALGFEFREISQQEGFFERALNHDWPDADIVSIRSLGNALLDQGPSSTASGR